jgi:hypothetical protein
VVGEAKQWLAAHQGEDAFLYLHLMDPHEPYRSHTDSELSAPEIGPLALRRRDATSEERELLRRLYAEEVAHVDQVLAPFLAVLPSDAIVVLTSDHGEGLGEHGAWGHGLNLFQEALEVPLLIRGPGVVAGEVAEPVQLLDLTPTVLDLMAVAPAQGMVGQSLLAESLPRPVVSTTFGGGPLRWAWRAADDKVVLRMAPQPGVGVEARSVLREARALPADAFHFDLAADPREETPGPIPPELLPAVGGAFARSAGRLVPGLQFLVWARPGPVEETIAFSHAVDAVQAWSGQPITVGRTNGDLVLRCADGHPLCAVSLRADAIPEWVELTGRRLAADRLIAPNGDLEAGTHLWLNEPRSLIVGGYEETMERLRALGYIE